MAETFATLYVWFDQPEEVRAYKPADNGWSINEILEHITLTTHFLLIIVRKGYPKALKRALSQKIEDTESDLDLLMPIGQRHTFSWTRPEHMVPVGKPTADVLKLMREQEEEGLDILSRMAHGEGSLYKIRMSVNDTGHIDLYQWLYFIAQHAKRHLGQIEENFAELNAKRVEEDGQV